MPQSDAERAALDAQYNLRAAVPEHLTYFARYERESAAFMRAVMMKDASAASSPA